ncbi:hypothetical protein HHI36_008563 [Cryptolaemus montrouzieri]|uniref:Prolyl 4-hydroxylase alpha subunit domain-containing protein n=1 Tax=Cryptolaemus montrouzieri TaxID=559131 RepID=A0ABD2MTD2_9CUCU
MKLSPAMRLDLHEAKCMNELKETWKLNKTMNSNDIEIIVDPFRVCILNNFLHSPEIVDCIRHDFNEITWTKRNMDLYEFFQSEDLKHIELSYIKGFYELLTNSVMPWATALTGYDLVKISATCSLYTNTDYLLVHDDQREDRMVAFVYYLTAPEGWDFEKGGTLDLLSKDEKGHPSKAVRSILPKNNQFIFFPVTSDSYHQIDEVMSIEDSRLTINGWFHAKTDPIFEIPTFNYTAGLFNEIVLTPIDSDVLLESWINESYLNDECVFDDIREYFEEHSEISLRNFFRGEAWEEVKQCLSILENEGENWSQAAPPNRSLYEVLSLDSLPFSLERFLNLFQSKQFFDHLKSLSDLDLKSMKFELQKWVPGSYCLLSDHDWNKTKELDIIVYFPMGDEDDIIGGKIQYVNTEEEIQEALITIEPSTNTLNMVYRDTARFTKYYSKKSKCKLFYLLICSYSE